MIGWCRLAGFLKCERTERSHSRVWHNHFAKDELSFTTSQTFLTWCWQPRLRYFIVVNLLVSGKEILVRFWIPSRWFKPLFCRNVVITRGEFSYNQQLSREQPREQCYEESKNGRRRSQSDSARAEKSCSGHNNKQRWCANSAISCCQTTGQWNKQVTACRQFQWIYQDFKTPITFSPVLRGLPSFLILILSKFRLVWEVRTCSVPQRTMKMHSVVHNRRLPSLYRQERNKVLPFMWTRNRLLQIVKTLQWKNWIQHWRPFHGLL